MLSFKAKRDRLHNRLLRREDSRKAALFILRKLCIFYQFLASGGNQDLSFCILQIFHRIFNRLRPDHPIRFIRHCFHLLPQATQILHTGDFAGSPYLPSHKLCEWMGCIDHQIDLLFLYHLCHLLLIHTPKKDFRILMLSGTFFSIFGCGTDINFYISSIQKFRNPPSLCCP